MLAPDGQTYNLVAAEQIIGPLQLDLLYEAIAGCVQKHSILRARYKFAKNQVIQTTTDTIHQVIHYQDISHSDNSIEYHIDSFGNGPFDLTVGQLFEACILRESQDRHSLILRQHRIVSDAQTLGILFREIVKQYSRLVESTQAPNVGMDNDGGNDNGYYDFSYQLRINLNDKELLSPASQRLLQEKLFWQERLHNAPVTQIPTAGKHHTTPSDKGCSQRFTLPSGFTPQITSLCETHGLSVFSLLLGTFKLALHSFTKQTDIIVVTPALNRHQAEFAHTVGHFMNRVAIRSHLDIQNSLIATLTKIHQNNLQALEHQSLPFEAMLEATGLLGRYRHEPLFQTVFMMQDTEQDESLSLPNIRLNPLKVPFHRSRYDLTGVMRLEQGVLHGRIDCKSELLNSLTLERFIQVWIELIETVVRYPNQQMSSAINYQLIHTLETDTTLLTENPGSAHKSQNNQNCDTAINYWRQALGTYLPKAQCNVTPSPDFWQLGGTTQQLVLLFNLIKKDFPTACFKEIAKQTQISSHQAYLTSLGSVTPTTHEIDERRKRYPTGDRHQLSPFQQRLWFLQKYHPTSQAYNLPAAFLIEGEISPKKLYNALCNTKKQFYLLNCGIIESDHTPYWSDSDAPIHWQVNDLSDMHPQDQDASLEYIADSTLKSTFDIGGKNQTPPLLWRCTWVQLSQTESVLFLCFHHLIADQVSGGLFLQSLLDHYHGLTHSQPDNLLQPETDHCNFKDFINFQYSWLKSTEAHDQRRFWQTYLAPCRDLDLEFTSTAQEFKTQELTLNLTTRQTASLVQLSKQTAVTLSTLLQTFYGIFLYRITGNTTFCIGMPISLHDNQWRNCFGPLLNTLPVKFETKPFLGLAQQVQLFSESLLQAIAHKDLPLEEILSTTSTTRTSDLPPLFQTLYSYLEEQPLSLATSALKLTTIPTSSETSDYPIALEVVKQSNALEMRLSLSESHFNQETRQQLTDTFTRLIEQCISDNTTPIQNYLIPHRSIIEAKPYSSLSAEFLSQTQSIPERTAIVSEYRTLSYSTLGLLAGNIQQQLAKHGVNHGQGIAILIEHREMLRSLLLACLASGIYFVPIDKRWEKERIHQVVVDSQVSALLMDSGFSGLDSLSIPVIQLADLKLPLYPDHAEAQYLNAYQLIDRSKPSDLAYIMYTSGSTGKPKGVAISQRALSSYSQNIPSDIKPKAQHNVLALTSLSFDIMITELLIPLLAGGTVAVFNDSLMPNALALFIKQHQVNYIQTTPSLWQLLLEAKDLEFAADTIALAGGETLPKSLATQLLDKGVTLYNVYGPTEATVWCSSKKVTRTLIARSQDYIRNIGTPFNNTQAMVCNQQLTELGEGAIGEMLLSGENLADGYWRNQALSETLFINHCTTDDSLRAAKTKVYRTGDRVQIINGEIYFLGRNDDQIKLNGQRIELNEINRAINKIDGVQAVYSTLLNRGNVPCLASYVCAVNLAPQTIKQQLIGKLPSHYVPSLIVVDPDTELSSNGKWHVAKMKVRLSQELLGSRQQDTHDRLSKDVANSAVMEVINAMAVVLDCKNIAPGDNFFDIGGNSLLAMRVINRLSESMNLKLTVRSIFESPTPIQLGHLISSFTAQDNANNNEELYEEGEI
ncbi:MAG: condensation domain-containing protein [Pseudomonadales bacterium]|nr:condensation domain-containing protein [Pseudomonadales bacterium]